MSHLQKLPIIDGSGRRKIDKEGVSRSENLSWRQPVRTPSNFSLQGWNDGTHERLVYMHTCLVGQHVEVQKIDGHVYSGIFHAAIKDKEFGVVLKMARLVRDGAHCFDGDSVKLAARKPPIRTYLIQGQDFVQIIAKDVSLSGDTLSSSRARETVSELVTDALVSQGWHRESERELKPWKPDDDFSDSSNINLSNTWSNPNWDQFEANKTLFGVETTFDEELYTTKLVRGPQLREREREAQRIAREIVGQQTRNVHLAEERGVQLAPELDAMDEETKFSSVGRGYEDVGDNDEDQHMDVHNNETFGALLPLVYSSTSMNDNSCTSISDAAETPVLCPDLQQTVSRVSPVENWQEPQDLFMEDVGSPDSISDPYKHHLRLRKLFVNDKSKVCHKGPGSPYSSPIGRGSPLLSPLSGDPAGFKALNLDPSCPQVPDDVYREFKEFKQQKQLKALKALSESFKVNKELDPRSPGIQASVPAVTAFKRPSLIINAKDFKLNPNAKSFTPSSCLTRVSTSLSQHPLAAQSATYMNSVVPMATGLQGSPRNLQSNVQQNQYSQYNHHVGPGVVAINSTSYMASPGGPVPGFPVNGVGGGGILPGQSATRLLPHSQQQAQGMSLYGHPQQVKYQPPTSALPSGLLHANGQLYPPHLMYGQPASSVVYMPFHQGHSVPSLGQGRLCSQPQHSLPQSR